MPMNSRPRQEGVPRRVKFAAVFERLALLTNIVRQKLDSSEF
jgi:hypothetical protein